MMNYPRGLRIEMVRGDLEFKPLEQMLKELPRVPGLDLEAKEEHVGNIKLDDSQIMWKIWGPSVI